MNLKSIMLSEINQSQKHKYSMIPLTRGNYSSQMRRSREENGEAGVGGEERGKGVSCSVGRVLVVQDESSRNLL